MMKQSCEVAEGAHSHYRRVSTFSCSVLAVRVLQAEARSASNWPAQSPHSIHTVSFSLLSVSVSLTQLTGCIVQSLQGHVRRGTNCMSGRAELGAVGQLQADMLHLELIDGADGYLSDKESLKASIAPPPVTKDPAAPVTMDTYRPKRPTTLNLFPIVPRTQVESDLTLYTQTHIHIHLWQLSEYWSNSKRKRRKSSFRENYFVCVIVWFPPQIWRLIMGIITDNMCVVTTGFTTNVSVTGCVHCTGQQPLLSTQRFVFPLVPVSVCVWLLLELVTMRVLLPL